MQLQIPSDGAKSMAHKYILTIIILFTNRNHGLPQLKCIKKHKEYMKAVALWNYADSEQSWKKGAKHLKETSHLRIWQLIHFDSCAALVKFPHTLVFLRLNPIGPYQTHI